MADLSAVSVAMLVRLGWARWARLAAWGLASVVLLGALLASFGWSAPWRGPVTAALALGLVAAVATIVALMGVVKHYDTLRAIATQVAVITAAYSALFIALTGISQSDLVRDRWMVVGLVALAIAGLACLQDWRAGLIATVAVAIVAVPVTAGFAALGIYGLLEVVVFGLRHLWNGEVTAPATATMVRHGGSPPPAPPAGGAVPGIAPGG